MTPDPFEYDVALSFAEEDRASAEVLASLLTKRNIKVFLDEYREGTLWGKDVVDHLVNLYDRKARYCIVCISRHYPLRKWTEKERASATERALRDADEYILLMRLDDEDPPGLRDLHRHSMESILQLLEEKFKEIRSNSALPSQSHDLRSGNVPSTDREENLE